MKKTLLSSLLDESSIFDNNEVKSFLERAEPNPFVKRRTIDLSKRDNMYDIVRGNPRLDKVSRTNRGPESGVSGSKYDGMVRDDEFEYDDDYEPFDDYLRISGDDDEDLRYISTKDPSYKKNEFNQDRDLNDVDLDVGIEFMKKLGLDDDDEFDDEELYAGYDPDEDDEDQDDYEDDEEFSDDEFDRLLNSGDDDPSDNDENDDEFSELDPEVDPIESKYEGIVRAVKGAYLVSKKQQPDETFTEVWMYNVGKNYDDEANVRKSILSATDIDPTKNFSEDGSQEAVIKTVGNVQFLTLLGLPD